MDPVLTGLVGIVLLLLLFTLNMPVSFAMAFVGFTGFGYLVSWEAAVSLLIRDIFAQLSSYPLNVIVLFVLMGSFAFASGMSSRLYESAYKIAGKMPAGLAVATILACSGFAAICGSTAATVATIGRVALPEMRRFGYNHRLATGCIASAGVIGILIPPSTIFIVYGILTEQSIGSLFAAGIVPGVVLTLFFVLTVFFIAFKNKEIAPSGKATTIGEKLKALWRIADIFLLFGLSIGGLFLGWYSPNQAAGVGAAGALLIGLAHRQLTWQKFINASKEGLRTACMIMMLIAGASVFGKFMAVTTIPAQLSTWVSGLPLPSMGIMALICVMFFVGGCFLDAMALIMLTIPIIYPVVLDLNYDPVWFGVVIVLISQIAVVTPPVGVNVYVTKGIVPNVPIAAIFRGTFPFLVAMFILLVFVLIFPGLILWLPNLLAA
ncbi:C4-dicarboxylate ABC transporter permease [Desulfosarcina ovata subsp. sediminis]|uniref:C4-dicarboxylate ABC transporter permease n=1 Tax=Desulfosarcina ovata subsp. sediminis TaxID=885957 RepID=A0A5K7ZUE2_9BACT|nr:TRAP transporter large permease [Desulfosarcina ovata]BBO83853.1 C4-dicarboxylate ABC transporter permease [Desulfosarcina ovata subsp. sediminis]